jgi:hypothetical protein
VSVLDAATAVIDREEPNAMWESKTFETIYRLLKRIHAWEIKNPLHGLICVGAQCHQNTRVYYLNGLLEKVFTVAKPLFPHRCLQAPILQAENSIRQEHRIHLQPDQPHKISQDFIGWTVWIFFSELPLIAFRVSSILPDYH